MVRKLSPIVFALLLFAPLLQAQTGRSSLSVNATGVFGKNSNGNNNNGDNSDYQTVFTSPTKSVGFLATYRYNLNAKSAVDLNYGVTRNTMYYTVNDTTTGGQLYYNIQANVHEATADYVYKPIKIGRLSPFFLAGGGVLIYSPTGQSYGTSSQERQSKPAFLYGGGADYHVFRNLSFRMQYRGLLYKAPDFGVTSLTSNTITHTAEPSFGLVFHF
jgi:opacity protein-like surface antigen